MLNRQPTYANAHAGKWPRTKLRDDPALRDPKERLKYPFGLKANVGYEGARANRREDVALVETALERTGHLNRRSRATGHMSRPLDRAVRSFQRANNLQEDGLLNPGGATVKKLAGMFGQSAPKPDRSPLAGTPALPNISAETFSGNSRSVRHLMSTTDDGLFPTLLSEAFRSSPKGRAEVADFFVQLRQRDPERAKIMRDKTVPGLNPDQEQTLDVLIDDLATGRAEEAEHWARENRDKEKEDDNEIPPNDPDKDDISPGEGGDDIKTPDEDDDGDGEEGDKPEKPESPEKPNCTIERLASRKAVQAVLAAIRQIRNAEEQLEKAIKERISLEKQIAEQIANIAIDLADAGITIVSGNIPLIIASATKAGMDLSGLNDLQEIHKELLEKISELEQRLVSLNEDLKEAERKEKEANEIFERCKAGG